MPGFDQVIPLGSVGQLEIKEAGGEGSIALSAGLSAGGGSVAGAVKVKASVEVDANGKQLLDGLLDWAGKKWPAAAPEIAAFKAVLDAAAASI